MIAAILSTSDKKGGAARAAYRLHKGLIEIGRHSHMVVKTKQSSDREIIEIDIKKNSHARIKQQLLGNMLQGQYINRNRTPLSNTIFTLPYPGYDLSKLDIIRRADIVNIHWVSYFQSLVTINKILKTGKPVVWTLHDQWAFTGGCHYTAGCNHYTDSCAQCPQIDHDPFHLPRAVLKDKLKYFSRENLTVVTPSRWLADCARDSRLFKDSRIEVIPNSLETDSFFPIPKKEAKKKLGIPEDSMTLLFVAEMGYEKRKGFKELLGAIRICETDEKFKRLARENKVNILCFGEPGGDLDKIGIHVKSLGYIKSDETIRDAYNAADLYILSSLEDNLPNTMLESMACETPVVSFPIGGMPDMIKNGETGALAGEITPGKLSEAILGLLFNPAQREKMGKNCARLIRERFALRCQAENYSALFDDLCKQGSPGGPRKTETGIKPDEGPEVEPDSSLGPNVKTIFAAILKKEIHNTIPGKGLCARLFKKIARYAIRFTPMGIILLFYRMQPQKIKAKLENHLRKHLPPETKK